jgi:hypothetical protein
MSAKLTPESCINKASSNSRLTAAGRWAAASDSHSQNCLQALFVFSLSLPLMKQQLNYTGMLKKILKLYCIWTWDTLWYFVWFGLVWFFSPLMRQWQNYFWAISRIGGWGANIKIIRLKRYCMWTWRFFNFIIIIYYYFIYFLFYFFSQSSLCLSNAVQLTVD